MINVQQHKCPQNHRCPLVARCPVSAITQTGFGAPVIDQGKCIECGLCAELCPHGAVEALVTA